MQEGLASYRDSLCQGHLGRVLQYEEFLPKPWGGKRTFKAEGTACAKAQRCEWWGKFRGWKTLNIGDLVSAEDIGKVGGLVMLECRESRQDSFNPEGSGKTGVRGIFSGES